MMNVSEEKSSSELDPRSKLQIPSTSQDVEDRIHSETRHPCSVCTKTFSQASDVNRHHRAVHERVRHPCSVCSKTFSYASHLKKHVRDIHEGKRIEFKCNDCQKVFYRKNDLKRHEQIDSGTQYPCTLCDKIFSQDRHLKTLIREIHEGKQNKFKCEQCAKTFSRKHYLKRHRETHSQTRSQAATLENISHIHTEEPHAPIEDEGIHQIHSFMVKVEDDSEEEQDDEEEV